VSNAYVFESSPTDGPDQLPPGHDDGDPGGSPFALAFLVIAAIVLAVVIYLLWTRCCDDDGPATVAFGALATIGFGS
jgi:hypothetical protein